eukprot:TRINITY_DN38005_c0_g1_i1.p1 TRINITY_DN38005_c0_g1~~TRINITY_DN38005_c0_g1_i1.p1  ORF type:complete len:411 (+),score=74.67 TRINITY_DN38005_c0_g1_i1:82-1314(+)
MAVLYFVDQCDKSVFTYAAETQGQWRFSRLSKFHKDKGMEKFIMFEDSGEGWVLQDQSLNAKGEVIGRPASGCSVSAGERGDAGGELLKSRHIPPLGKWLIWGAPFQLTEKEPVDSPPLTSPLDIEVPFAKLHYFERGDEARLEVLMNSTPIEDDTLEEALSNFRGILENLARRPRMILLIRSDARDCAVPSVRHIRRFLAFIKENGSEFVLVGRGHAIVLNSRGWLGSVLLQILRLVQRMFPAPWPETVVSSCEDAEAWLAKLAADEPRLPDEESTSSPAAPRMHSPTSVVPALDLPTPMAPAESAEGALAKSAVDIPALAAAEVAPAVPEAPAAASLRLQHEDGAGASRAGTSGAAATASDGTLSELPAEKATSTGSRALPSARSTTSSSWLLCGCSGCNHVADDIVS